MTKGQAYSYIAGHQRRSVLVSDLLYADMPTAIDSDDRDLELYHRVFTSKLAKPQSNGVEFVRVYQDHGKSPVLLHRVIASRIVDRELTRNDLVRHVDADGLNNRRSNLSVLSVSDSRRCAKTPSTNTSGYKNVCWQASNNAYSAYVNINKVRYQLGFHKTAELANEAVLKFRLEWGITS
jgi:hypothetical protein